MRSAPPIAVIALTSACALGSACVEYDLNSPANVEVAPDQIDPSSDPDGDVDQPKNDGDKPDLPSDDCIGTDREVIVLPQDFPAVSGCDWDVGWNLDRVNELNRAMREESRILDLPNDVTICKVSLKSTTDTLWFDDHVTLSLNDYVLVGGGYGYPIDVLPVDGDLPIFDWRAVRDTPFQDRNAPYWCLGETGSVCDMPQTDSEGPLNLVLGTAAMTELTNALVDQGRLSFELRTFGDDNDSDCSHSDMSLELRVEYVWQ